MRRVLAVALLLISATLVSCGRTTILKTAADECDPVRSLETGTTEHTLDVDGRARTYLLHLPENYDGAEPIPVMFLFHGFGGDPKTLLDTTKMGTSPTTRTSPSSRRRVPDSSRPGSSATATASRPRTSPSPTTSCARSS